jgi:hypothetical protein
MAEGRAVEVQQRRDAPAEPLVAACPECGTWPPVDPVAPYYQQPRRVLCRGCFCRRDERDEAEEHLFPWRALAEAEPTVLELEVPAPAPAPVRWIVGESGQRTQDLEGQVFGKLTALRLEVVVAAGKRARWWRCRCECGTELVLAPNALRLRVRSCRPCAQAARGAARRTATYFEAQAAGVSRGTIRWRRRQDRKRLEGARTPQGLPTFSTELSTCFSPVGSLGSLVRAELSTASTPTETIG